MKTPRSPDSLCHWPRLRERAASAVAGRLRRQQSLTPPELAATVAGALPVSLGRWLLAALRSAGWLEPRARIPFDILEDSACPAELRGPMREVVRLAIFGLPGQGRPEFKHRDSAYQQICSQIVREASDLPTLSAAAGRALSHPDVCGDPGLAAMVRTFIAEREAALRTRHRVEHPEPEDDSQLRTAFEEIDSAEFPTRKQLLASFMRHQKDFEVHLAQYNEAAARYAVEKLRELARRFPVHIDGDVVTQHEEQFEEFSQRCTTMQKQIDDVTRQAVDAAREGDQKTASWLLKRLRAIHALTPVLLPQERFETLREQVLESGRAQEHREALREVIAREREVATQIKQAGGVIYRFHKVASQLPPESEQFKRAEAAYREAVDEVRKRDTEWLTGLLLELETYFEDLNDPAGKAQEQLDRFIGTVRSALNQLRLVIRAIQRERVGGGKSKSNSASGKGKRAGPNAGGPSAG